MNSALTPTSRRPRLQRGRIALVVLIVSALVLGAAGAAFAVWNASSATVNVSGRADSLQPGNAPTLTTLSGQSVTIGWNASTGVANAGVSASGYTINRYSVSSGGTPTAAANGCSGTINALTCTETSVPVGTWFYALTPHLGAWVGAESSRLSVTVSAATFSITAAQSLSAASLPANVTGGAVAHFANGENLTFHLDTANGTILATTPSPVTTDATGAKSGVSISIPANLVGGTHTIWAVGATSALSAQSNGFTITSSLSFTPGQSFSTLPGTLVGGSASGFGAGENLTFHLDTSAGTTVASTPSTVTTSAGGTTSSFTVTIPTGTSNGSHTVVAVGNTSTLTATSNSFTVSTVTLSPNLLQIESKSGGVAGKIQAGDHLGVTFNNTMTAASVCPGKSASFSIAGTVTIKDNVAPISGNDELVFTPNSGQCTGNVTGFASGSTGTHAGYIDLGSKTFVTANATIASSTLTFVSQTNNIQVTFGGTLAGGGAVGTVTSATGTYFPDSAIQTSGAVAASGSVSASSIFTILQPGAVSIASGPSPQDGKIDTGDTIIYSFSEQMDPDSILSGWDGTSTAVAAHFDTGASNNALTITGTSLGSIDIGTGGYVANHGSRFDVNASMAMTTNGSGQSVVTVTLTANGPTTVVATNTQWTWSPSASATDLASNPISATPPAASASKENF